MQHNRSFVITATLVLSLLVVLGVTQHYLQNSVTAASNGRMVPHFEVDPFWPQPLPNKWILGSAIGVAVDARDHVYIVHRTDEPNFGAAEIGIDSGRSACCTPAPPVLEFHPDGSLVNAWGGPGQGYTWPATNHGIEIAPNGNVWIGGNGGGDSHVVVFTNDGQFVREIGIPGEDVDSNSTTHFNQVAEIAIDPGANEAYIADGYGNKRVAVVDVATGAFKRYWGAYGNRPSDDPVRYTPGEPLPQQFVGPVHCAEPSNDGLLYVCDRGADRIQVFRPDGTYIKEAQIAPLTVGAGATWDIAFSQDDGQEFIYVADGSNMKVHVVHRDTLEVMYAIGEGGRQPGLFYGTHSIDTDSQGNFYTTETYEGKRVQKFVYRGLRPLEQLRSGPAWPADTLLD
ncbi:MAG: beta-propeller fold lactonase family protein [Proteobacteria bacterium]|nr:beta-propeller fold lactonase family protein [Pseudomonadota bacterium]